MGMDVGYELWHMRCGYAIEGMGYGYRFIVNCYKVWILW